MVVLWDAAPCSLVEIEQRFTGAYWLHHQGALMTEVVSTSETSIYFYQIRRRNIAEDSHFLTCRRENLKS
jgi:hypothetical protein